MGSPKQGSSISIILGRYHRGCGFESRQGREILSWIQIQLLQLALWHRVDNSNFLTLTSCHYFSCRFDHSWQIDYFVVNISPMTKVYYSTFSKLHLTLLSPSKEQKISPPPGIEPHKPKPVYYQWATLLILKSLTIYELK